jgi:hypothetical protein
VTRATLLACAPAAFGAFDFGLLALAGPAIAPAVGTTGATYPWLFSASSFAYAAAVIPAAALIAKLGPTRALRLGLTGAAVSAGTLAAASGPAAALTARALNGAAGALAATAAIACLAAIPSEPHRRRAFAALGGAVAIGFATGALAASITAWRPVLAAVAALLVLSAAATRRADAGRGAGAVPGDGPGGGAGRGPEAVRGDGPGGELGRGAVAIRGDRTAGRGAADARPAGALGSRLGGGLEGAAALTGAIVAVAVGLAWAGVPRAVALGVAGVLGSVAVRRARPWLPRRRGPFAAALVAGAATTASGVGGTILIAPALQAHGVPGAVLGVFALAVVPGARLARRLSAGAGPGVAAAAGLGLQAAGLAAVAGAMSLGTVPVAAAIVVFGIGHVAANGGAAAAVVAVPGIRAPAAAALLIAAQYVGGGVGAVLLSSVADARGARLAIIAAAAVAVAGAVPLALVARRDPRLDAERSAHTASVEFREQSARKSTLAAPPEWWRTATPSDLSAGRGRFRAWWWAWGGDPITGCLRSVVRRRGRKGGEEREHRRGRAARDR